MLTLKNYVYSFSAENPPEAHAASGDVVRFITHDCFEGQIKTENDLVDDIDFEHTNPATGPLYVDGAEPGDVLAVDILNIDVAESGVTTTLEGYGALWPSCELRTRIIPIEEGCAHFNGVKWPIDPMIGVIGTAPADTPVPSGFSFNGGGNMDSRLIRKGSTVYFPVRVPGALLAMGDLHASMGDGEVSETGIEITGEVIVRVRLIKQFTLNWPVTQAEGFWFVNTNGRTCDVAIKRGYEELQRLIMDAYGWDATDATLYISMRARLEANQAVIDENETDEEGDTFRVGIPIEDSMPRIIPI